MATEPRPKLRGTRLAAGVLGLLAPALTAQATGSASGLIVDSLLRPIPVARVEASRLRQPWIAIKATTTDGSGRFVLGGLPFAPLWLRCSAAGQTTEYLEVEPRPRLATLFGLHRVLFPAAPVSGRVIDPGGQPLAGAAVVLTAASGDLAWDGRSETVTDAQGGFRCDDVALGPVVAWVHVRGHGLFGPVPVTDRDGVVVPWQPRPGRTLRVHVKGATPPRYVVLSDRPSGVPRRLPSTLSRVELDADGLGEAADLPALALWVCASGDQATFGKPLVSPQAREVVVAATPFVRIAVGGRLLDDAGRPLHGVVVSAAGPGQADVRRATTDLGGRFAFEQAMPAGGRLGLRLWGNELALASTGVVYLRDSNRDLELHAVPTAKLSGRVVDARGQPVPGATVRLIGGPRWVLPTDGDGRFLFDRITDAGTPVGLEVESPFGTAKIDRILRIRNGEHVQGAELQLRPPARLEGVVRDAQGAPMAGATVVLRPEARKSSTPTWATITDRKGRFVAQANEEGKYRVLVQHGRDDDRTVVDLQLGATLMVELTAK